MQVIHRTQCLACGGAGAVLYSGLKDFSYAAPGEWSFRKCENAACGLVWLDPALAESDIGKAYESYYTHQQPEPGPSLLRDVCWSLWHSYLGARFGYTRGVGPRWLRILAPLALLHPGGRDELDAAAMHLPAPRQPARLLEVGCGSGVSLARMQSFGWEVEGVEVDPQGVKAARSRGVKVHWGQLEAQQFPSDCFDAIYSAHVIEHIYDVPRLLRECRRILKPGGTLVLLTPNVESWGHRRFGAAWLGLDPPRHLALYSGAALRRTAEEAGLKIQKVNSTVRIAWVCCALSHLIARTGRGEMSQLSKPAVLLRGFLYQYRERLAKWSDAAAGEELRLVATK